MPEFKYFYFLILGIFTLICVVLCSYTYKSRKVIEFPHIYLFGKKIKYLNRFIPFLLILLIIFLTIASMYPYREEKLFSEKKVYNIIVCLDVSNSMKEKEKLKIAKNVLRDFVLKRDIEDRIGIVVFDNVPFRLVPLTTDRRKILRLIPSIHPAMVDIGGTSMYDALIDSLNMFSPALKNKIVILLSDGGDINSKNSIEDVINQNRITRAKIYAIGISSGIYSFNLERIASSSGGKAFFVKGDYSKALQSIFEEINRLEPSFVQEYSFSVEKPEDMLFKIGAFITGMIILLKVIYTHIKEGREIAPQD
ncbi:VWA domain-containing protein [Persephonella atlantica]|uniref:VWA domain-containing protein n=1 Tax=Persephonella atlantica TaxID=2699429 RepID=A0ABS1GFA5_9AQUI|nr:VWA domain-containing protein [Persephonella atlantica]MBK3331608.1 VWA domain-containing protein [Persephonella atlantica]